MVKGPLVDRLTAAGRKLVELLDAARLNTKSAFWLYRPESDEWELVVALPEAQRKGPVAAYRQIYDVFAAHQKDLAPLRLDDIVVMSPSDRLIRLLGDAIQTGPSISEIRFTNNRVGDTLIEDALIYRLHTA